MMSSKQSAPKRFRIEKLEERITPGFLLWTDHIQINAMTQWGLLQFSESEQSRPQIVSRNTTIEGSRSSEAVPCMLAQMERTRIPAWAAAILREIEHDLNSKPVEAAAPAGVTSEVTFFSDFLRNPKPAKSRECVFPVWAQELLVDLEVRPEVEIATSATVAEDSIELSDEWSTNLQTQCEVSQFPTWAEELLSAVDRRITHDSRMAAAGRIDATHIQQFSEVVGKRLPSAR